MALNFDDLVPQMLAAAQTELKGKFREAKGFAEQEFKKLLENTAYLAGEVASGKMTAERAQLHLEMQQRAAKAVLLTVKGIGMDAAEQAIHSALAAVKDAVNAVLPVKLL